MKLKKLLPKSDLLALYWRVVVRPHWVYVLWVIGLMFLTAFLEMATVGLGVPLIEAATHEAGASQNPVVRWVAATLPRAGFQATKENLIFALLIVVSLTAVLRAAFYLAHKYGTAVISQILRRETKEKLFRKMMCAKYEYLSKRSRGAIIYDINYPAQSLYQIIAYLGNMVASSLNALLLAGMMFYLAPLATLTIGVVGGGWMFFWRRVLTPKLTGYGKKIYELNQTMGKVDVDAIDGIRVVKSHALESKLIEIQHKLLTDELHPRKLATLFTQGVIFVNEVAAGVVLIVLGTLSFGLGLFQIAFSKLVVLLLAVKKVAPAASSVGQCYLELGRELKNVQVLEEILAGTPQEESGSICPGKVEAIRFDGVGFSYRSAGRGGWKMKGIDFELRRGEVTAIVGPTGSGKSTLANLLMGFYRPVEGGIRVNGEDLGALDLAEWRKKIGYVSQDIFLFNETVRLNLSLWDDGISDEHIWKAVAEAQMADFIRSLPQGLETPVGDRGVKLSGGQAQRLAIARAILRSPEILIFDEATSALDNLTEKAVYEAIHHLRQNAIVLVIAHRLSTVKEADKILVLDKGSVAELGTHESLVDRGGVYARLYQEGALHA